MPNMTGLTRPPCERRGRMEIRPIRTEADYDAALQEIEQDFENELAPGTPEADRFDFLEDASINFLVLAALAWSARARARVGMLLAAILLVPGLATLWMAWHKFALPFPPAPLPLSLTGLGAFIVNLSCALMLARFRH